MEQREVMFASKLFVLSADGNHLMTCDAPEPVEGATMRFVTTVAYPMNGAFLLEHDDRWVFVVGWSEYSNSRALLFDDSNARDANAAALCALGIPVLSTEAAETNVRDSGLFLSHETAFDRKCAAAARGCAERETAERVEQAQCGASRQVGAGNSE